MTQLAIVYHSGYGHTEKVAKAVQEGANAVEGVKAMLIKAEDAAKDVTTLNEYDGIIFGSPTYMGSASAVFKTFAEASSKIWFTQGWKDKIAAGFTNSGSQSGDKSVTLQELWTLAMQHSMIWVGLDLMPGNNSSKGSVDDLNRLGSFGGLMTQSNSDEGPDKAPKEPDLKTARHFGARVATATKRWKDAK